MVCCPALSPEEVKAITMRKVTAGVLPRSTPVRLSLIPGSGHVREGCEEPITEADVLFIIGVDGGRDLRFHAACAKTWYDLVINAHSSPQ